MDIESIIGWLRELPPAGIYLALWMTTYIENIFPPSPSDVIMLFIATMIGFGTIGHVPAIMVATLGSVMGFLTAFIIGRRLGRRIVESEKIPFITIASLEKVDRWFDRYGYWVIVVNRFLAGTRGVISFFAGMSRLDPLKTTILCTISALAWNIAVIELGAFLGGNWRRGEHILKHYGLAVTIVLAAVMIFMLVWWFVRRKKSNA